MKKRILSLFLTLAFCVSLLPTPVSAQADGATEQGETIAAANEPSAEENGANETETKETKETPETVVPSAEENGGTALVPNSSALGEAVSFASAPVEYIDKDGNTAVCTDYTLLNGDPDGNTLDGTAKEAWYVLSGSFGATQNWNIAGNVNIILADGSNCNTDGHYFEVAKDAVITIYGQSEGTGTLSIFCEADRISAFGGTDRQYDTGHRDEDGERLYLEMGFLAVYGGNVCAESTKYNAVSVAGLTVMGGTVTAKAASPYSAIHIRKRKNPTLAANYKVCKADNPQEKISVGSSSGVKVLITECTDHIWGYAASETAGMHTVACTLCSTSYEQEHTFDRYGGEQDETTHNLECICGEKSANREAHDFEYSARYDTLTHTRCCRVCSYGRNENEDHDFSQDPTRCSKCQFERGASVELGGTFKNCKTLAEAIGIAAGQYNKPETGGGTVILYGKEECFAEDMTKNDAVITVAWGGFTVDFNGADLSFPKRSLFDIKATSEVTFKNGKFDLSGDTPYSDNSGIMLRSGELVLENMEITASCNTRDGHVQHPAVKALAGAKVTAKNVIFNGGFESRRANVTPFTSGSFVRTCEDADNTYPVIKLDEKQNIAGIIAEGYALARYDDPNVLVPMYDYNEDGVRVDLNEIYESVTVVPHAAHTFDGGYCACGYRCDHTDGFDENETCKICGAHAVAGIGDELFTEFSTAFARASALSAESGENITIRVIYDLGDMVDEGYATGKVTLDLNGHDLRQCDFFAGKEDENGIVTAEGDLTITDSSSAKNGQISDATLIGGKLAVNGGYSMSIKVNGGEAFVTDHAAEAIYVYGGTANLSGGSANEISVFKGELNLSDTAVNRLYLNSDSKTNIFGGKISKTVLRGGELNIGDGIITELTEEGGKLYIPYAVTGPTITVFEMTAGEAYIECGDFSEFSVDLAASDDTNPKVVIEGGEFEIASFSAKTKGRITLYGGLFSRSLKFSAGSSIRTVGDILAENFMFHKTTDNSLIPNSTERIDEESVEVRRHRHAFSEKTDSEGRAYGECKCGSIAEAAVENADSKRYYETFEQAVAALTDGDTIRLCSDIECEDDVTVTKGVYRSPVTLNLDGRKLHFADGKKLILSGLSGNPYFNVVDRDRGDGSLSYLSQESGAVRLYGGTYGKIESVHGVTNLKPTGYGFKKADGSGWVTEFDGVKELADVTAKKAPFTGSIIVTNDPDGTTVPDVIYLGQTVYFKAAFSVDENEPQIAGASPMTYSIFYDMPDGDSRTVVSQYKAYKTDVVRSEVLSETSPVGVYNAGLRLDYLGCTLILDGACSFNIAVCPHNSFTDDVCDICGLACKHTDVSEDGVCAVCKKQFGLQLIKTNGKSLYYTSVNEALTAAGLEENKGCTVKLYRNVTMTVAEGSIYLDGGEFTIDLNGYDMNTEIPTSLALYLKNADVTIKTSVVRNTYTCFYPTIRLDDGGVFRCRHEEEDSYISLNLLGFVQTKNVTAKMYLGAGVYLSNLSFGGSSMKTGDVLEERCVFTTNYGRNIIPRSDTPGSVSYAFVIKCPHEWEGDKCKYCDFVCSHEKGYVNGVCPICKRACEHKNMDEKFFCPDCEQQMTVKIETTDGTVTYNADFTTAMNAAEDGTVVTLLTNAELSQNVSIHGSGKTVTLNLNGYSASSPGKTIRIGVTDEGEENKGGTLKLVGNGSILTSVVVNRTGAFDWSGWTGGEIQYVSVYYGAKVTGSIPSGAYIGKLILTGYTVERIDKIDEIALDGGRFGEIRWQNFQNVDLSIGVLLAPGYAFQKEEDNTFAAYTQTLAAPYSSLKNVKVVKCEDHAVKDGKCEYCNSEIAAYVADGNGDVYKYCTNIKEAVNAQLALGDAYTVKLLRDFAMGEQIEIAEGSPRIDLNGHTVDTLWLREACRATILGSGTINYLGISKNAGVNAATPIIDNIWIMFDATWSSILPDASYGYKVRGADGSYTWYDSDSVETIASSTGIVKNAAIAPFPITEDPILLMNGETIADGHIVSTDESFKFSVRIKASDVVCVAYFTDADGSGSIKNNPMDLRCAYGYESEFSTRLGGAGDYYVWAEVTKDGYKRTTEKFRVRSKQSLADAVITLNSDEFTYAYPGVTYTNAVASVTLAGKTIPETDYTVSGELSGTDAGSYTVRITATKDGSYAGSAVTAWKILPCELTDMSVGERIKRYDGTTEITLENSSLGESKHSFTPFVGGAFTLERGKDYEVYVVSHEITDLNALAGRYNVTYEVTLKNSNYTFKENGKEKNSKRFTKEFYIDPAESLPNGCEPSVGSLIVRNGVTAKYRFDVSALLKELPEGLKYNGADPRFPAYLLTEEDSGKSLIELDGKYYTDGAGVDENGILTLPINDVYTKTEGDIGTVRVGIKTQNYGILYVTVNVRAENRIVPTGAPTLDKTEITYGEKISSIKLSGKMRDDVNYVDVEGTFAWNAASDFVPNAGIMRCGWTFTPDDAVTYATAQGSSVLTVNKAAIPTEAITAPAAIDGLVYRIDITAPQTLHTEGKVTDDIGTMKYTVANPESADTVWSEEPITSRNAGEFTVYYKVFGDANHLDSAYGTINCRIAKYEITYKVVCLPKTYDGEKSGDPGRIDNVKFFGKADRTKEIVLADTDYKITSIEYKSENVGGNFGTEPVEAEAAISLTGDAAVNYALSGGTASGYITPAPFKNIDFIDYTYEICRGDTVPKSVTPPYFGAPNNSDYEIHTDPDMTVDGDRTVLSRLELIDNARFTFSAADGLGKDAVGKSVSVKLTIYSKDHNYRSGELSFTVRIIDKATPDLFVEPIKVVYDGKAVPKELIHGTATIDGHKIEGTWDWDNGAPTNVSESGDYTVVFTPTYPHLYYGATAKAKVTIDPRSIGDEKIFLACMDSYVYTGAAIMPKVFGEYKYDENKEARELIEDTDYTVVYPEDTVNVGEKKMTVSGRGNFGGTTELVYIIKPCTDAPQVTLLPTEYVYDGSKKTPTATVKVNGRELTEGKDFEVSYSNNENAEDGAKAIITAKGNYGFAAVEISFRIAKADSAIVNAPAASGFAYDGLPHALVTEGTAAGGTIEYKLGDGAWSKAVPTAKDAGNYTVWYRVVGDSNHNDIAEKSVAVTIEQKDIADAKIVLGPSLTYNREEQIQTVSAVRFDGGIDATFDVRNNRATNVGTYELTVVGTGNFKGERTVGFTVAEKTVTASVTIVGEYSYNGKDIEPADIVVKDGEAVIPASEYTVSFENNRNAGTAKVIITDAAKGNYIVNGTGEFEIQKAKITVRPKNISKVYGSAPEFKLESESDLITEEELRKFENSAKFESAGAEKTAEVLDGGYTITAILTDNETDNLILSVSDIGTLTVMPAKLTIRVNDVSREYGAENPALSVSYEGFVNGENESVLDGTLTLAYSADIHETTAVGLYEAAAAASGQTGKNYDITYVPGNVTVTKIPVRAGAGAARSTYLSIVFDKGLEGLSAANFVVKDSDGNPVAIASVTALTENKTYTLGGSFAVGKNYTVKVTLDGSVADATHQLTSEEAIVITPIHTSGGSGSGGNGGSGGTTVRYTVTFDTDGGSEIPSKTAAENSAIEEPSAPTKEGFDFAGWYVDKEHKEKYDFTAKVTRNITLYAAWVEKDVSLDQIILTIGEKTAKVFGQIKTNDVAPKIVNNRTMLPARFVAENLGAEVFWDSEKRLVTIVGKHLETGDDVTILICIGSDIAYVNGREVKLDSPAFIENNRTYTPIRFISEELGASVEWIETERKVVITK